MIEGISRPPDDPDYQTKSFFSSVFLFARRRSNVVSVSSTGSVAAETWTEWVDASGGAVTRTLPPSADWRGREIRIIKSDSSGNAVTVARSGSDLVGFATSQTLAAQGDSINTVADGTTNWGIF